MLIETGTGGGFMTVSEWVQAVDEAVWGPPMLLLLMGTGVYLTIRTRFLAWRNLGRALGAILSREARRGRRGGISPFSALMTTLAATIGTGNIVGVATALTAGGPGALVWMEISALFGLTTKFAECMLAVKYQQVNDRGELCGGPMYVMRQALPRPLGSWLGGLFALFTVLASFGIGDMTQANSIAGAVRIAYAVPVHITGAIVAGLSLLVVLGGIRRIARVSDLLVPLMAGLYLAAGLAVLWGNRAQLPQALATIFRLAVSPRAAAGGAAGALTVSALSAVRYGVARGVFSNEAGMGSAAITAASAAGDGPVRQGYISMTGTFFDTLVVCTVTGLAICSSGALGTPDGITGAPVDGAALTIRAFESVLGPLGGTIVTVSIVLFAFSSILGWAYQGEKALEYLAGGRVVPLYRAAFALAAYWGAAEELDTVFRLSDICNAWMALPNLLCLLALSGTVAREMRGIPRQIGGRKRREKL